MRWPLLLLALILAAPFLNGAESTPSPISSGGDAHENWLLGVIRRIHEVTPGMTRADVERILAIQRGIEGKDEYYHFPGYPQIQVKVRYRSVVEGNDQRDIVEKIDPPFLVDAAPQQRPTE